VGRTFNRFDSGERFGMRFRQIHVDVKRNWKNRTEKNCVSEASDE
jgi:hypothetical protein